MEEDRKRIGEIFVEAGLIYKDHLARALQTQRKNHNKLASIITQMGFVDEGSAVSVLGNQLRLNYTTLDDKTIPADVISIIPSEAAKKFCVIPVGLEQKILTLAMADPNDLKVIDEIAFMSGMKIMPVLALESNIRKALNKHYKDINFEMQDFLPEDNEGPSDTMEVQRFVSDITHSSSYPLDVIVDALIDILNEKNIVTKSELSDKIRKKLIHKNP
jgi:type IV pilus assembly protein PilB